MTGEKNAAEFVFLKRKIMEINTAIFKPDAESSIIPNNIITTQEFSDDGHIWFYTSCHKDVNIVLSKRFYATLEYFNKGTQARISVLGDAILLEEHEAPDAFLEGFVVPSIAERKVLLVQLKVQKADFHNVGLSPDDPWLTKLKLSMKSLLYSSNEKKKLTIDFKS